MVSVTRSASFAPAPSTDEQRHDHQRQQQHQRRDRRQCPTASEAAQQPLIHRVAQSREDGRQQDRQQERTDHGHERHRDRRDQQQQEGLSEARLGHREAEGCPRGTDTRDRRSTVTARART